jgi:hypothetical protein
VDPVDRFAEEAAAYERWALHGTDSGAAAAREGLTRIAALYAAGLALPELPFAEGRERGGDDVTDEERKRVLDAAARLPFDVYGIERFDRSQITEENIDGMLSDDVADVYSDVVGGLRAYRDGRRSEAVWQWRLLLEAHWGSHAVRAMRALHDWLLLR